VLHECYVCGRRKCGGGMRRFYRFLAQAGKTWGARGEWRVVGRQNLCSSRWLYRDLRRFALALATSRGKRPWSECWLARRQLTGTCQPALGAVAAYAGSVSPRELICVCSSCERVVAGSGRPCRAASILPHADATAQAIWQMCICRARNLAAAAQISEPLRCEAPAARCL
jgi:hypothetical protein